MGYDALRLNTQTPSTLYYFTPKRDERKEERKRVESNVEEPAKCLPQRGPVSYVFHASCQAKLATPLSSRTGAILLQETSYKQQLYQDG